MLELVGLGVFFLTILELIWLVVISLPTLELIFTRVDLPWDWR